MDPLASRPESRDSSSRFYHGLALPNDQYAQYVQNYYREYYRHWIAQNARHRDSLRAPLKYGSARRHSRASFSQHDNCLVVVDCQRVHLYHLHDLFLEFLVFSSSLHAIRDNRFPFRAREDVINWIRAKENLSPNLELKLVLKVLSLLARQQSVSGLDLSELLLDIAQTQRYSGDDYRELALDNYRQLLIRGQKSVALSNAVNSGLFDHAIALSYLMSDDGRRHPTTEHLTLKTIRKFCETLSPSDPIHVLYSASLNSMEKKKSFQDLSLDSFLALLSNEMDLTMVSVSSQGFQNLLALVKSLVTGDEDFVLSEELFENAIDSIVVNECLEFCRFSGARFNPKLIEKKVFFAKLLFDFGFSSAARQYSQHLRQFSDSRADIRALIEEIESRFDPNFRSFETTEDDRRQQSPQLEEDVSHEEIIEETTEQQMTPLKTATVEPLSEEIRPPIDFYPQPVITSSPIVSPPIAPLSAERNDISSDIPFSFVSNSQSMPTMPFTYETDFQNKETTEDNRNDRKSSVVPTMSSSMTTSDDRSESENKGFLAKLLPNFNFRSRNQAILPDDSNKSIVWDKERNQWVNTDSQDTHTPAAARPPPPVGATTGRQFEFRSQRRYVDITRRQ